MRGSTHNFASQLAPSARGTENASIVENQMAAAPSIETRWTCGAIALGFPTAGVGRASRPVLRLPSPLDVGQPSSPRPPATTEPGPSRQWRVRWAAAGRRCCRDAPGPETRPETTGPGSLPGRSLVSCGGRESGPLRRSVTTGIWRPQGGSRDPGRCGSHRPD